MPAQHKTSPDRRRPEDTFDWVLTHFFRHLVEVCHWPEQQALAEIERAIGAAEVPYRVFEMINGEPVSKQEGLASFWRSDVRLRLIKEDAEEKAIDPEVEAWPAHIGWDNNRYVWRVQSRVVQACYLPEKQKKTGPVGRPPEYDVTAIRTAAENYIATYGAPDKLAWFCEKVCDRLTELHIKRPGDTYLKQLLSPIWNPPAKRKRKPGH